MGRIADWKPYERFVQPELPESTYLSGAFTMLAAGPPRLANMGGGAAAAISLGAAGMNWAYPIGVLQGFNIGQNKQVSRFFELGSQRSYFIAGRTMGSISLNRVMYHGPSLLRIMYAYYQDILPSVTVAPLFTNPAIASLTNMKDIKIPPGYENIFMNLASDLFDQPIGILMYFKDTNEQTVAAMYAEACYIANHGLSVDSSSLVMQENAALQYERLVPVSTGNLVSTIATSAAATILG